MVDLIIKAAVEVSWIALAPARWLAEVKLDRIDADVARWYVDDDALRYADGESEHKAELRDRRRVAARNLRLLGGADPTGASQGFERRIS